jgi:hypothetical protein
VLSCREHGNPIRHRQAPTNPRPLAQRPHRKDQLHPRRRGDRQGHRVGSTESRDNLAALQKGEVVLNGCIAGNTQEKSFSMGEPAEKEVLPRVQAIDLVNQLALRIGPCHYRDVKSCGLQKVAGGQSASQLRYAITPIILRFPVTIGHSAHSYDWI